MRFEIGKLKAVSFDTRRELNMEELCALLNEAMTLKISIKASREEVREEAFKTADKELGRLAGMKAEGRVKALVEDEWRTRVKDEVLGDKFWCDVELLEAVIKSAEGLMGGVMVPNFQHFVIVKDLKMPPVIRVFAPRMF